MIRIINKKTSNESGVDIGRPSPLGNPFSHLPDTLAAFRVASRDEAIKRYRDWLLEQLRDNTGVCKVFWDLVKFYKDFGELTLVCWCVPKRCHGEVIKELIEKAVNGEEF
jgi:hypothetical protein